MTATQGVIARSTGMVRSVARWELLLVVVLIGLIILGSRLSPFFLTPRNFSNLLAALMEVAIMALPMTLVVIAGEIDLSVESMAGLSCAIFGFLWAAGVPVWIAVLLALGLGAIGGLMNGLLVALGRLPSLVVTLGTLALFRGLALIVLGPRGISNFPPEFTALGFGYVPGTLIPWPFVIFLALAATLAVVLHWTWVGRQIFAIGKSTGTARFSGVRVTRLRIALFTLAGLVAALAGVILTARLSSARADAGQGMTLAVVTVVLLGGVDIFGGRGTIPGVVLAVLVIAVMQNSLRLARVPVEVQSIALGLLLVTSVVLPNLAHELRRLLGRIPRGPRMAAGGAGAGETGP